MQFVTLQFFFFFIAVFSMAILLKENKKYYRWFLLAVSLIFYLSFGIDFFLILLANIGVNYLFLQGLPKFGKKFLGFSIIVNVLFLGVFKYYNFGIDSLLLVLNHLQIPADITVLRILIPVGISFYTFRNISHLIDCYRQELSIPSFIDFANYVAFFPQIMSGPIVRPKDFYSSLHEPSLFSYSPGRPITLILSGLLKKYVVASYLFDFATSPFASPANYSTVDLITSAFAYSIMIFVDFSGYSDLAIGISNLLGFHVHRNFLSPYSAIGLKDFWNRWHISLSAWLRDYVYIPLGGSRKGIWRKYFNIVITMLVSGLWHGAGVNFVVWGLLHGIGSVVSHLFADYQNRDSRKEDENTSLRIFYKYEVEMDFFKTSSNKNARGLFVDVDEKEFDREVRDLLNNLETVPEESPKTIGFYLQQTIGWAITFVYITFTWIFFTSSSLENALNFINSIFFSSITEHKIINFRLIIVISVVLLFNFIGNKTFRLAIEFFDKLPLPIRIPAVAFLIYLILQLGPETMPPFIYFSF